MAEKPAPPINRSETRDRYYQELLALMLGRHDDFLNRVCRIWQDATAADWAGLWLLNDLAGARGASRSEPMAGSGHGNASDRSIDDERFVLNGTSPADGPGLALADHKGAGSRSFARWVTDGLLQAGTTGGAAPPEDGGAASPTFVEDVEEWSKTRQGDEYRVEMQDRLEEHRAFIGVPFVACPSPLDTVALDPERPNTKAQPEQIIGVLTLHYENKDDAAFKAIQNSRAGKSAARWLARLTASAVAKRVVDRQVVLAEKLSLLTNKHLTRFDEEPVVVRADYAEALRDLLKEHLGLSALSIFWRNPFDHSDLDAIATTGLIAAVEGDDRAAFLHKRSDLHGVSYGAKEPRATSSC